MLKAASTYAGRQARWHGRLMRAIAPYGDDSASVGEALHRAAADLWIEATGRTSEELAELVMAAAEARAAAP